MKNVKLINKLITFYKVKQLNKIIAFNFHEALKTTQINPYLRDFLAQ